MNFSILETTRRLLAPEHELSCSWFLWRRLLDRLRERGGGRRESGAFLLGARASSTVRIRDFVLYDDLDPRALDHGYVRLDGRHLGKLWSACESSGHVVVADVHTHPGGCSQSESDQSHPMIACAGHLALIIPRFAEGHVIASDVGIYRYLGAKRWHAVPRSQRRKFFHIGL